jgi:hypothetical protein
MFNYETFEISGVYLMCVFISPCWTWPSFALGLFFALVVLLKVSGQSLLFDGQTFALAINAHTLG